MACVGLHHNMKNSHADFCYLNCRRRNLLNCMHSHQSNTPVCTRALHFVRNLLGSWNGFLLLLLELLVVCKHPPFLVAGALEIYSDMVLSCYVAPAVVIAVGGVAAASSAAD